jgi:hypothetical protein
MTLTCWLRKADLAVVWLRAVGVNGWFSGVKCFAR